MLDFVFILTIILETAVTVYFIKQIIRFEKKVKIFEKKMIELFLQFVQINTKARETIKKLNKVVSIFTNKKFITIKNIVLSIFTVVQVVILIKSLNLKGGLKEIIRKDNIKKILFTNLSKKLIKNFFYKLCI